MKKILTIFTAAIVLAGGFLFSSCSDDDDDEFFGPTNTWCEAPITKKADDGSEITLGYIAAVYCDEDYVSTGTGSSQLKKGEKLDAGITVVLWGDSNVSEESLAGSVLNGLSKTTYIKKTFPKGSDTEVSDADGTSKVVKGSRLVWSTAYVFNKDLHNVENQKKLPEAPVPVISSAYSDASETLKDFSWKTVLKQYLISSL